MAEPPQRAGVVVDRLVAGDRLEGVVHDLDGGTGRPLDRPETASINCRITSAFCALSSRNIPSYLNRRSSEGFLSSSRGLILRDTSRRFLPVPSNSSITSKPTMASRACRGISWIV